MKYIDRFYIGFFLVVLLLGVVKVGWPFAQDRVAIYRTEQQVRDQLALPDSANFSGVSVMRLPEDHGYVAMLVCGWVRYATPNSAYKDESRFYGSPAVGDTPDGRKFLPIPGLTEIEKQVIASVGETPNPSLGTVESRRAFEQQWFDQHWNSCVDGTGA